MMKIIVFCFSILFTASAYAQNGPVIIGSSPLPSGIPCSIAGIAQSCPNVPAVNASLGLTRVLGTLRSANFNSTADQPISITSSVLVYQITSIVVTNCSVSLTLAVGGFYPAASKSGTPIIAATQVYSALNSASVLLGATVAATPLVTRYTASTLYFALTTAQGSAATCDIYIVGNDLT
jgi:hypothetical protein